MRESRWLNNLTGAQVYLKLENLQITGSFKFRGALNVLGWAAENHIANIYTASAGNHGLGVAEASKHANAEVTVCVPTSASPLKKQRLRGYNIRLIEHGEECQVAEAYARRLAAEKKGFYVSPYNNKEVMAGQGTIGLEMLQAVPELTTLVVAVGGGGLIGGIATAARAINPKIHIVGVVAANSPVMKECVRAGRILPVMMDDSIADGIMGNIDPDSITFPVCQELVDEWVAVEERDIEDAIFDFLVNEGMIIEGAAGAAVAAVSHKLIQMRTAERIGIVVCGGNIAAESWQRVVLNRLKVATAG